MPYVASKVSEVIELAREAKFEPIRTIEARTATAQGAVVLLLHWGAGVWTNRKAKG